MISVIIPTVTGGLGYMARLIPNLIKEQDIEIIIVNNNSRDGTNNYLGQYNAKIIVNNPGRNFSQSNNQGAQIAKGEYLLFLNNDTVPKLDFTKDMLKMFEIDPETGIVGCLLWTMENP